MYAIGFRYYFTPLPGYFSPFPHGTCPLSVTKEYLGLTGGPARFVRNFRGSVLLGKTLRERSTYAYRGITIYAAPSQTLLLHQSFITLRPHGSSVKTLPTTPHMQHLPAITHIRFGLFRFRSPLLTESRLFSLPVGTEMFHFPTFPPTSLYIQEAVASS